MRPTSPGPRPAPPFEDCETKPHKPLRRAKSDPLVFLDGETDCGPVGLTEPVKRVRVISPYLVAYAEVQYWPDSAAEVPASVADKWLLSRWVTEE